MTRLLQIRLLKDIKQYKPKTASCLAHKKSLKTARTVDMIVAVLCGKWATLLVIARFVNKFDYNYNKGILIYFSDRNYFHENFTRF